MSQTKTTKLIVNDILPRTSKNELLPPGLILMTDDTGKTIWTTVSTLSRTYAQFTSLSTSQGLITADSTDSVLNIVGTDGINLNIISNTLYIQGTSFNQISLQETNCNLHASNTSNNQINTNLTLASSDYITIAGNPDTCTLSFDFSETKLFETLANNPVSLQSLIVKGNTSFNTIQANAFIGNGSALSGVTKENDFIPISNMAMKNAIFTEKTYGSISTFYGTFLDFGKEASISSINTNELSTSVVETDSLQVNTINAVSVKLSDLSFDTLSNSLMQITEDGIGKFQQVESRILTATTTIITPEIVAQTIKGNGNQIERNYHQMKYHSSISGESEITLSTFQSSALWHMNLQGRISFMNTTSTMKLLNLSLQMNESIIEMELPAIPTISTDSRYLPFSLNGLLTSVGDLKLHIKSEELFISDISFTLTGYEEPNFKFLPF
jgi:hypothetical protein